MQGDIYSTTVLVIEFVTIHGMIVLRSLATTGTM